MARDRSPDGSSAQASKPRPIRQRSALGLAVACGGACLLILGSLAWRWADDPQPWLAACVVFALAVVWSLFVRPAVLLDESGVTIRNIVRDVFIPWGQVSDVESRWNLKVFVDDKGYTAWAISSQVERPARVPGGLTGSMMAGRFGQYAETKQASPSTPKVTAQSVAKVVERAKEDYAAAVSEGALPAAPDTSVRVTWVPWAIAILVVPAVAIVIFSIT